MLPSSGKGSEIFFVKILEGCAYRLQHITRNFGFQIQVWIKAVPPSSISLPLFLLKVSLISLPLSLFCYFWNGTTNFSSHIYSTLSINNLFSLFICPTILFLLKLCAKERGKLIEDGGSIN